MKAIVTIKLSKNPLHNPKMKISGNCPISITKYRYCSDITGEHHSYIEEGLDMYHIEYEANRKWNHITRIEVIEE